MIWSVARKLEGKEKMVAKSKNVNKNTINDISKSRDWNSFEKKCQSVADRYDIHGITCYKHRNKIIITEGPQSAQDLK